MAKDTSLELCTSVAALGNGIAIHALELMNVAKTLPLGFKEVTLELLELGKALLTIKAGLNASQQIRPRRHADAQEVNERLRQGNVTLSLLDHVINKLLANESKKGLSKLGKGFKSFFSETDLSKLRNSMVMSREALNVTIENHAWAPPISNRDEALSGFGFAALAAVLNSEGFIQYDASTTTQTRIERRASLSRSYSPARATAGETGQATAYTDAMSNASGLFPPYNATLPLPPDRDGSFKTDHDGDSHQPSDKLGSPSETQLASNSDRLSRSTIATSKTSPTDGSEEPVPQVPIRIAADPTTVPRRLPNSDTGAISAASVLGLASAVCNKNYRMVEQLLDRGVRPDHDPDANLLQVAIQNHDLITLRYLLMYGAEPNHKAKDGNTALHSATETSFTEAAALLLDYGADPNMSSGLTGDSPLGAAIGENKTQLVQLYLKYCADVDGTMHNGQTPMTRAITATSPAILVEMLVLYGADVNRKNSRGESALFRAITNNRIDLVNLLLSNGADADLPAPKHMLWPSVHNIEILKAVLDGGANLKRAPGVLELATSINSFEAVTLLLKYGADPNAKKDGIFTPLCTAIRDNREELVDVLIAAGADPNLPASEYPAFKCVTHHRAHLLPRILLAGANPSVPKGIVETAVMHSDKDALAILLKHKVNPNARGSSGETALTRAIKANNTIFIDMLLAHHADPGVRGQEWPIAMAVKEPTILAKLLEHISTGKIIKGALEMAVVAGQLDSVKLLLAKGISVEEKNGGVFSPLTTSIREDRKDIFRYLVDEAGADVNAPGEHLPIIKAIRRHRDNDLSYIEHLLLKGADINLMYRGWNAVLQAVDNGDVKVLKLLAECGKPDLSAQDENGRSVLEIMDERGLEEEERILLQYRTPSQEITDATARLSAIVLDKV